MVKDKQDKILDFVSRKYPNKPAWIRYDRDTKKIIIEIWEIESNEQY